MINWADFGSITTRNNNKARRNAGFAVRTRLELATYGVTGRYSNQLNYRTGCSSFQKRVQRYCFFMTCANFFEKKCT